MNNTTRTLFISDLHLSERHPNVAKQFMRFMSDTATRADALYILGDFFDVCVGDHERSTFNTSIIQALNKLAASNVPVFFMHGNRDFLIGKRFLKAAGCTYLTDPCTINLYGKDILLTHGDYLCTDDIKHQQFRHFVDNKFYRRLFLMMPLFIRRRIGQKARQHSHYTNRDKTPTIMDVTEEAVHTMLTKHETDFMIHGHTHRPAVHRLTNDNGEATRVVLPAWDNQHAGMFIYRSDHTFEITEIKACP